MLQQTAPRSPGTGITRPITRHYFITLTMVCEAEIHLIMGISWLVEQPTCNYVISDDKFWFGPKMIHSSSKITCLSLLTL